MNPDDRLLLIKLHSESMQAITDLAEQLLFLETRPDPTSAAARKRVAMGLTSLAREAWRSRFGLQLRIGEFNQEFMQAVQQVMVHPDSEAFDLLEGAYARVSNDCQPPEWKQVLLDEISEAMELVRKAMNPS
jgi:hypothetical protein